MSTGRGDGGAGGDRPPADRAAVEDDGLHPVLALAVGAGAPYPPCIGRQVSVGVAAALIARLSLGERGIRLKPSPFPAPAHVTLSRITTSANSTVTCLYSADVAAGVIGEPHLLQNRESGGSCVPHDPHTNPVAVMPSPSIWPQRRHEHRSRQHRVTSYQPTCALSPVRSLAGSAPRHASGRGCGPDSADVRGQSVSIVRFCRGVRSCGCCSFGGGDVFVHRCGGLATLYVLGGTGGTGSQRN
jgi:hypothetical protein